jgi:hypothetical protein
MTDVTFENLDNTYYVWDPLLAGDFGLGRYQTIVASGGSFFITPGGGSYASGNFNVESGQGFFVRTNGGVGIVTFHETDKAETSNLVSRENSIVSSLRINLSKNINGENVLIDGVVNLFDGSFSNSVDKNDAKKLKNPTENISIKKGGQLLTIEKCSPVLISDTIFYNISEMKPATYNLELVPENLNWNEFGAFLIDQYLGTSTEINVLNSSTISFEVNSDSASFSSERFMLVFRPTAPVPVRFINVNAIKIKKDVIVNWSVGVEQNTNLYNVEKSEDGLHFVSVATVIASHKPMYDWTDSLPFTKVTYYRIKSVDYNGAILYSKIVKVVNNQNDNQLSITPNPVTKNGMLTIESSKLAAGEYQFAIKDNIGRVVYTSKIRILQNTNSFKVKLPASIPVGYFVATISDENFLNYNGVFIVE